MYIIIILINIVWEAFEIPTNENPEMSKFRHFKSALHCNDPCPII